MANREDLYIRHQIELAALTRGELNELAVRFEELLKGLQQQLRGNGTVTTWSRIRVEQQIAELEQMVASFYGTLQGTVDERLTSLAELEAQWNAQTLASVAGVAKTAIEPISGSSVMQAVRSKPFQGREFSEWWTGLEANTRTAIATEIRQGWAFGDTLKDLEQRLAGTLNKAKQNTWAVVRSGVANVAAEAKEQTFADNEVKLQIWSATLDSRTSPICRLRDMKVYTMNGKPVGHKLRWLDGPGRAHWGCRSTALPVLKGENAESVIAEFDRPSFDYNKETKTKATSTLRYDAEDQRIVKKGERNPNAQRRGQPTQTRANYQAWFDRQPAWVQDKVLGKRKGALYRKGKMQLSTFSEDGIKPTTIAQLQKKGYEL